jgi:hypothetical protein
MHNGNRKYIQQLLINLGARDNALNLDADGSILLQQIIESGCKDTDWIQLAQNIVQKCALVNEAVSSRFSKRGTFIDQLDNYQFIQNGAAPHSNLVTPE